MAIEDNIFAAEAWNEENHAAEKESAYDGIDRALAPMRSRDNLRNVVEGIEQMGKEEAAYWLGMAMHRKNPRRVLSALRILLTSSKSSPARSNK